MARQTHDQLEVIVVDDASTVNVARVVEEVSWPDSFVVQVHRTGENVGPGGAREIGRMAARGDYLCYLDSDDLWHPEKVSKQLQAMVANPEAGMCYCPSKEFAQLPMTGSESLRRGSDLIEEKFLPCVLHFRPWGTGACMWTKVATDRIGPWLKTWAWEDYEYDCRAGCLGIRICFVPEVLCYYRRNESDTRLSEASRSLARKRRAPSLLSMVQHLDSSNQLEDPEIRTWTYQKLAGEGCALLIEGELGLGREILKSLSRICRFSLVIRLWITGVLLASSGFGARLSGRLGRKFSPL